MRENPYLANLKQGGRSRPRTSTTSSAPICTATMSAGTRGSTTAAGFRPSRTPNICSRKPTSRGSIRAASRRVLTTTQGGRSWTACCRWWRQASRRSSRASIVIGDGLTIIPAPGHSPGHQRAARGGFRRQRRCSPAIPCIIRCRSPPRISTASPARTRVWRAARGAALLEECCEHHRLARARPFRRAALRAGDPQGRWLRVQAGALTMLSAVASQRVGGGTPLTPSGSAADPKPEEQVDRNEPMDIAGAARHHQRPPAAHDRKRRGEAVKL